MPQTNTQGGKFVERFEMAVMEYVILDKARQGEVTKDNIRNVFTGNLNMKYEHLDHCVDRLVQENHLTKEGNKLRITDDGREDLQQVQNLALEIGNVAKQGGGQQRQTQEAQATGGGTRGTPGNVGQGATMQGQPKGGPGGTNVGGGQQR